MRIRFAIAIGAASAALVLSSCGGGGSTSPLDNALGYLPKDAPMAVAVSTDLNSGSFKDLDIALQRFGVQGGVEGAIDNALSGGGEGGDTGFTFSGDIKPLLGNDLVIGILPGSQETGPRIVAALQVPDGGKAEDLFKSFGLHQKPDVDGAHVYGQEFEAPGSSSADQTPEVAVKGDTVVAAESGVALKDALDQRSADDRLTESAFDDRLKGLPTDGLIRATGDLQSSIDALGIQQTSGVAWMAALRSFGASIDINGRTLTVDAQISTDHVDETSLPLAAGASSPALPPGVKSAANADQSQSMRFALDLVRASVPVATYNQIQSRLERAAHGSLGSLEERFGAGLTAQLASGERVTRSDVKDPAAVTRTLASLISQEPAVARAAGEGGAVSRALDAATILIPALPIPQQGYFPEGSKVTPVAGHDGLYVLSAPAPQVPPGIRLAPDQFFFGILDGVFVTAPSLKAAQQAAHLKPQAAGTPPGAFAFSLPLDTSDVGLGESGRGIKLTTVKGAVEASSDGLRLRAQAGL